MGGIFTQIVLALGILQFMLPSNDQTMEVTEELVRQHEEQREQEMALLLEMQQRSQEQPEIAQGSLLLSACQHWWFWASAEMLLLLFGFYFYWLPRQGSSGHDCSACRETPAEPKMKRRKRRLHGIADYGDKMDQIMFLFQRLECKDMQNSEEDRMEEMINASAKPFPQKTFGQSCIHGLQ